MTSWHKTGAHPFYIGMYIHIYTHIYVHKNTSQKECLHSIFYFSESRVDLPNKHHTEASLGHSAIEGGQKVGVAPKLW